MDRRKIVCNAVLEDLVYFFSFSGNCRRFIVFGVLVHKFSKTCIIFLCIKPAGNFSFFG